MNILQAQTAYIKNFVDYEKLTRFLVRRDIWSVAYDDYVQDTQNHSVKCYCNCSYVLSVLGGVGNKFLLLFLLNILPRARNGRGDTEIFLSFFLLITSLYNS